MGKSTPDAPAPPDYAAANREGIYADVETLPLRRLIDYASRAGEKVQYAKPGAEERFSDTRKLQDEWDVKNNRYQALLQEEVRKARSTTLKPLGDRPDDRSDRARWDAQNLLYLAALKHEALVTAPSLRFKPEGSRPIQLEEDLITADFTGKGDLDLARLMATQRRESADLEAASQLAIAQKYGEGFQQVALDALKRQDPAGYAGRQELAAGLRKDYSEGSTVTEGATSKMLREKGIEQALASSLTDTGDNDLLKRGREAAMRRSLEEFDLGGELSPEQQRQAEQAVRAGSAARGQALSSSGVIREAMGKYNLGSSLSQSRLNNLMNVGQQTFGQETALAGSRQALAQSRLANLFNAQNTEFTQETSLRQENQQQQQRRLSNLQSYVLGAPISSGFQSLQGAQQGAAPYTPIMTSGIGQNANAGAASTSFAGNVFGTQAQLYNTQMANSGSPLASILGSLAGGAAGAFSGGVGAGLAKSMFTP